MIFFINCTERGASSATATEVTDNGNTMTEDAFANAYYAAVMGTTATGTSAYTLKSTFNTAENSGTAFFQENDGKSAAVDTGKDYKVYAVCLTFWLEGYDADCFDAILGQDMDISLSLTTEASN